MTRPRNSAQPWRVLWLFPVAVIATLSIIASGGGGGDDDNDVVDVDPPLNILPNYNFFLANVPNRDLMTVAVGGEFTFTLDIGGLFAGGVDLSVDANNLVTFLSYSIRASNLVDLTFAGTDPSPLDGTISIEVTEQIDAMIDDVPYSGVFDVRTTKETVVVTILANGVQISLNGGPAVVFNTWDEFANLIEDDQQETWQRRAALAANALQVIVELFFDAANILDELEAITFSNPVVETCDLFTGTPPEGVIAQGDITITWLGSGELADGDDFDWQFNECWNDEADQLFSGAISLENYTETIDSNNGTLFEIGFGGVSGEPGGVIYELTISDTVEDQGIFAIPPEGVIIVDGGFALIIQAP